MWKVVTRLFLAGWFIGMIVIAVWNGRGAVAQGSDSERLYFPLIEHGDLSFRDYVGLVELPQSGSDVAYSYYTVRGDSTEWSLLLADHEWGGLHYWSPDGATFAYQSGYETQDETVEVVSLATRQPRVIFTGAVHPRMFWSPDSRYLAFSTNVQEEYAVKVYDTQTEMMYSLPFERYFLPKLVWSPDSQMLAWVQEDVSGSGRPDEVWLWEGEDATPRRVYTGDVYVFVYGNVHGSLVWSPDSTRMLFNAIVPLPQGRTVYSVAVPEGDVTVLLTNDYFGIGWMDGGTRLLLGYVANDVPYLYIANADGSNPTPLHPQAVLEQVISISPDGRYVMTGRGNDPNYAYLYSSDGTRNHVSSCRVGSPWQNDSRRFVCSTNDVLGFFGTTLGDVSSSPPTIQSIPNLQYPRFIADSTTHFAADAYIAAYPAKFQGSFLFNMETNRSKRISYPMDNQYRVLEWRYLP